MKFIIKIKKQKNIEYKAYNAESIAKLVKAVTTVSLEGVDFGDFLPQP